MLNHYKAAGVASGLWVILIALGRLCRRARERVWDAIYIDPNDFCGDRRAALWAWFTLSSIQWQWTVWGKRTMREAVGATWEGIDEREGSLAAAALLVASVEEDGALLPRLIDRVGGSAWKRGYADACAIMDNGGSRGCEAAYSRVRALLDAAANAYDISSEQGRDLAAAWLIEAKRVLTREFGVSLDEAPRVVSRRGAPLNIGDRAA